MHQRASTEVLVELDGKQREKICSFLYHKFAHYHTTSTVFKRSHPQSFVAPYTDGACAQLGSVYVISVRGMLHSNGALLDDLRSNFCTNDCDISFPQGPGDVKFSLPMWLAVSYLFPEAYAKKVEHLPPKDLLEWLDRNMHPKRLLSLWISLFMLFLVLFLMWKVPDDVKIGWIRGWWPSK
jgi:hypothetical protein